MSRVSRRRVVQWLGAVVPVSVMAGIATSIQADGQEAPGTPPVPVTPPAPGAPPAPPPPSNALDEAHAQYLIGSVKPAVVLLEAETEGGMAWGSGFFISSDGLLITNRHVVKDAQKLTCLFKNKTRLSATVLKIDPQYDLALVLVHVPSPVPTVALGDSDTLNTGQLLAVTGYPQPSLMVWIGMALDSSTSRGSLNGPRFGGDVNTLMGDTALQIDAPVTHGNSGGPVFRLDTGEVVGVLTRAMEGAGNVTFAVPINPAKVMVSDAGRKLQHNVVKADAADAVVEPGELRSLNTVSVSKELPPLFGSSFAVIGDYGNEQTQPALNDWYQSTGVRLPRVTPMALDGDEIFFGAADGRLRAWNIAEFDNARILLDTGDGTVFTHPPTVNSQIICATAGALDLSSEMKTTFGAGDVALAILSGGLLGGGHSKEEVTIDGVGHVFGLNRRNGNIDWEVDTGFVGTPILYQNKVYYGGMGERGCLDAFQGNEEWKMLEKSGSKANWFHVGYAGPAGLYGVAVPVEGKRRKEDDQNLRLYGNGKARVEHYDPATGKVVWKTEIGDVKDRPRPLSTAMFVDPKNGVVYALAAQIVAALRPDDGSVLWTYDQAKVMEQELKKSKEKNVKEKIKRLSFTSNMLIHDGIIYVGSSDRKLHALSGQNGSQVWTYNTRGEVGPPTYYDGQILFGSADGYIHVIDARTGALVWRAQTGSPVRTQPLVHKGMVYAATEAGAIYTLRIPVA